MAWSGTFNWANASSFNGEARKLSILTEMILQLNIKATCVSVANMDTVVPGDPLSILIDFDDKFEAVANEFYDHILEDGSKWTVAKLETQIGASKPGGRGAIFSPTWINWMYQAINLLVWKTWITEYTMTFPSVTITACWYNYVEVDEEYVWKLDPSCPCSTSIKNMDNTLSRNFGGNYTFEVAPGGSVSYILDVHYGYTADGRPVYSVAKLYVDGTPELHIGLELPATGTSFYWRPTLRYRSLTSVDVTEPFVIPFYNDYGYHCNGSYPSSVTITPTAPAVCT